MDCDKALELLDCVRPNSGDQELPEFSEAFAHLESCETCQQKFETRQEFDLAIHAVVRDVEVPESLKASLLTAALAEAGKGDTPTADSDAAADSENATDTLEDAAVATDDELATNRARSRRRTLLLAGSSIVCGILLALVGQFMPSNPRQFTVAELLQQIDSESDSLSDGGLEDFDGSFEFRLPAGWSSQRHLSAIPEGDPHVGGLNLDEEPSHDLARVLFRAEGQSGFLMAAIPASRIKPSPPTLAGATVQYLPKQRAAIAWTERDTVYVVYARRYVRLLEELREILGGRAA